MRWLLSVAVVLIAAQCFPVSPTTPSKAKCGFCWEGACFNNASCNGGCRCFKRAGEQTGECGSLGYTEGYLQNGFVTGE